jgi:uncharacterized protein VirK/YbjX
MAEDHKPFALAGPLSLFGTLSLTLDKMRRDGVVEFTRMLAALFESERPLAAIARHREVVAFFNQPSMAPLKSRLLANKYLGGYLAKSFGKCARRDILLHHYRRIAERAEPGFLHRILTGSYLLWSKQDADTSYSITLSFDTLTHYEGDLSVVFMSGSQQILRISFSIVPGSAAGSDMAELLFVGHVQGAKHKFEEIKQATKACHDVAPQHMLMLAIQSIACALGITVIAGVTDENQLAKFPERHVRFQYNSFWENWAGRRTADFYEIPVPLPQTALHDIQSGHRRRTRKKREFKKQVALQIAGQLDPIFPCLRRMAG